MTGTHEIYLRHWIPEEVLILIASKAHPIHLREIPEALMNQNGWYKMKPLPVNEIVIENNSPPPPPDVPACKVSVPHLHQSDKKDGLAV